MQNAKNQLHFIIGIGRSGTTILTKLLNTYKDIHCMPEANFLVFFLRKFSHKNNFSRSDIDQIYKEIELYSYSHPWVGWNFDLEEAKKDTLNFIDSKDLVTLSELSCFIYRQFKVEGMDKNSSKIIIDKNPSFTIFVSEISRAFPESKFIWIVRDYRANVLSRKQSVFLKSPDISYNATRWNIYNQIAYKFYKKNKEKVLLVRYEDLVKDEDAIENILSFLSADSEKKEVDEIQPLNLETFKVGEKYRERFFKKYSDLNKKLNSDRINSWKEQLTSKEIELCDAVCGKTASYVGYRTLTNISFFNKAKMVICHTLPIGLGYLDILKDKVLFYLPIQFKLNRLRKKYIELGFIKK